MTTKYNKLTDSLYLTKLTHNVPETVKVKGGVNHLFIYDRSGSMYGHLDKLATDMKRLFKDLSKDDTLTLAWFSGEGSFNFVLKGFRITNDEDVKKLNRIVDENSSTIGTTCFSEVLAETDRVIKDLSIINNSFALTFFTDGYPVVSKYANEIAAINTAIEAISGKVASSMFIGYGDFYNKELMASMAAKMGGQLSHSSDLSSLQAIYEKFIDSSRVADRVAIDCAVPAIGGVVYAIINGDVTTHEIKNGQALLPLNNGKVEAYALSLKPPASAQRSQSADETALYAGALVMAQRALSDVAIEVLGYLGDVALVNKVANAFTNEELGKVEAALLDAIKYQARRYQGGKVANCVPDKNAFCVLDALKLLMDDEKAEFQPFHEDFKYKKVGRSAQVKPGYPEFVPDKESRVPLNGLVWNSTRLNLSLRAQIGGTVDLGVEAATVGLDREHQTNVWRNYTIIRDGILNVSKLPVSMSKETYTTLLENGAIDKEHARHYAGRVYTVHLDRLPVMNRSVSTDNLSATVLAKLIARELELEAEQKVLNTLLKDEPKPSKGYTQAQAEFLKTRGITSSYNPPVEKLPATDFYMAKEFAVKASGFSSLPKLDDVQKKLADKKPLTGPAAIMAKYLTDVNSRLVNRSAAKTNDNLRDELTTIRNDLTKVRSKIQETKFTVLLANKWFNEFSSRNDCSVTVPVAGSDVEMSFVLSESKVEI